MIDGQGIFGFTLHYAFLFAMTASALLVLIVLWRKKRLDMDESPKFSVFEDSNHE